MNQSLAVLLRERRFTTEEWGPQHWRRDTPDNPTYMRQIDSSPTGDVRQCAMQRPLYPCTGGTLINTWSVIQPAAVSYPPMPPVMALLLFWNANPVIPYMNPGEVTYQPLYCWPVGVLHQIPGTKYFVPSFSCLRTLIFKTKRKKARKKRKEESFMYFQHSVLEYVSDLSTVS